jgi:nucleoside-diphosphate-sugar epimerase
MIQTSLELEQALATPSEALIEALSRLEGDIMLLGAGGKMGGSLARLARNAVEMSAQDRRIVAVSRYSNAALRRSLEAEGIHTIQADLLADGVLDALPDAANIMYMVGMKFGSSADQPLTWAMNTLLAGKVAERFRTSRIVAFSTGNIYPLTAVASGGASEALAPGPVGEYAQSCLGRERLFEYASQRYGTPLLLYRLNYANDLRYGVLVDVARAVLEGRPVDLSMGYANVIWQGDANEIALRALHHCTSPAEVLNVTGLETLSIRWLAQAFAERFDKPPLFTGREQDTALLSNAAKMTAMFGAPRVSLEQMIDWTAHWLMIDGETLHKPTHFQERKGKF